MVTGGTFFEELGFHYLGPFDGHDVDHLLPRAHNAKEFDDRPVLSMSSPRRAKATRPAENAADKYHGVAKFNVVTGEQAQGQPMRPSYTKVFAQA